MYAAPDKEERQAWLGGSLLRHPVIVCRESSLW